MSVENTTLGVKWDIEWSGDISLRQVSSKKATSVANQERMRQRQSR